MQKKFSALLVVATFLSFQPPEIFAAQDSEDNIAYRINAPLEKIIASLPQAEGKYKSTQRPILIQGAMNSEIEIFIKALQNPKLYNYLNYIYIAGTYKNYPVIVSHTEQGVANAAAATALALNYFNPVAVINQGTAGGYDKNLNVGNLIIGARSLNLFAIKTAFQHEGAGFKFEEQEMRGTFAYNKNSGEFQINTEYLADEKLLKTAEKVAASHKNFKAVKGTIGTADTWNQSIDYINFLHEKYGPDCEEMETAAAAQICLGANTPFIGVRVISNNITNGEKFNLQAASIAQNFTLLMVEDYIQSVLKKITWRLLIENNRLN